MKINKKINLLVGTAWFPARKLNPRRLIFCKKSSQIDELVRIGYTAVAFYWGEWVL